MFNGSPACLGSSVGWGLGICGTRIMIMTWCRLDQHKAAPLFYFGPLRFQQHQTQTSQLNLARCCLSFDFRSLTGLRKLEQLLAEAIHSPCFDVWCTNFCHLCEERSNEIAWPPQESPLLPLLCLRPHFQVVFDKNQSGADTLVLDARERQPRKLHCVHAVLHAVNVSAKLFCWFQKNKSISAPSFTGPPSADWREITQSPQAIFDL